MRTLQKTSRFLMLASVGLSSLVFVSGCGGGGSSTTVPSQNIGTYRGTYLFPGSGDFSSDSGNFVLRVQSDGKTTGVFNEEIADRIVTTSGTTNLSSGRVSLSAKFNNDAGGQATLNVSGQISGSSVTGTLALKDNLGNQTGTFEATKSSADASATSAQESTTNSAHHSQTRRLGAK